jgi:hypothetical protein
VDKQPGHADPRFAGAFAIGDVRGVPQVLGMEICEWTLLCRERCGCGRRRMGLLSSEPQSSDKLRAVVATQFGCSAVRPGTQAEVAQKGGSERSGIRPKLFTLRDIV